MLTNSFITYRWLSRNTRLDLYLHNDVTQIESLEVRWQALSPFPFLDDSKPLHGKVIVRGIRPGGGGLVQWRFRKT